MKQDLYSLNWWYNMNIYLLNLLLELLYSVLKWIVTNLFSNDMSA